MHGRASTEMSWKRTAGNSQRKAANLPSSGATCSRRTFVWTGSILSDHHVRVSHASCSVYQRTRRPTREGTVPGRTIEVGSGHTLPVVNADRTGTSSSAAHKLQAQADALARSFARIGELADAFDNVARIEVPQSSPPARDELATRAGGARLALAHTPKNVPSPRRSS